MEIHTHAHVPKHTHTHTHTHTHSRTDGAQGARGRGEMQLLLSMQPLSRPSPPTPAGGATCFTYFTASVTAMAAPVRRATARRNWCNCSSQLPL